MRSTCTVLVFSKCKLQNQNIQISKSSFSSQHRKKTAFHALMLSPCLRPYLFLHSCCKDDYHNNIISRLSFCSRVARRCRIFANFGRADDDDDSSLSSDEEEEDNGKEFCIAVEVKARVAPKTEQDANKHVERIRRSFSTMTRLCALLCEACHRGG